MKLSQKEAARMLGVTPAQIRAAINPPYADYSLCYRISCLPGTPTSIAAKHPRALQPR